MRKSEIKKLLYVFCEEIKHVTDLDQAADNVYDEYAPMPHDPRQRTDFEIFVAGYAAKIAPLDWPRGTLQVRENAVSESARGSSTVKIEFAGPGNEGGVDA